LLRDHVWLSFVIVFEINSLCWLPSCQCHGYAPAQLCSTLFAADPSMLIGFYISCFVRGKDVG
jgi:hypothetical protein